MTAFARFKDSSKIDVPAEKIQHRDYGLHGRSIEQSCVCVQSSKLYTLRSLTHGDPGRVFFLLSCRQDL
jgi:hypothetical protein